MQIRLTNLYSAVITLQRSYKNKITSRSTCCEKLKAAMQSLLNFAMFFENHPLAFALLTPKLEIVAANNAFFKATLSRSADIIGTTQFGDFPHDINSPDYNGNVQVRRALNHVLATHEAQTIAVSTLGLSFPTIPASAIGCWVATYTPTFNSGRSEIQFILLNVYSIAGTPSPSQETHIDLEAQDWNLHRLFEQAPGFMAYLKGPQHIFVVASDAFHQLAGSRRIIGKPARQALPELERQGILERLDEAYISGNPFAVKGLSIVIPRTLEIERARTYVDFTFQPIFGLDNLVKGIFVQSNDVTEQRLSLQKCEAECERMLYISQHDSLTGLPNRTAFYKELEFAVRAAEITDSLLHVLFIDVDRLKEINDSFGHDIGDKLLKAVATRLEACINPSEDFVARLSGDEFGVISRTQSEAALLASRFVKEIAEPFSVDDRQVRTSVSIGVATYPKDGRLPIRLLKNADLAMYLAKQNGRSTYKVYTETLETVANRRRSLKEE